MKTFEVGVSWQETQKSTRSRPFPFVECEKSARDGYRVHIHTPKGKVKLARAFTTRKACEDYMLEVADKVKSLIDDL